MKATTLTFAPGWEIHLQDARIDAGKPLGNEDLGSVAERSLIRIGDEPFLRDTDGSWLSGSEFLLRARTYASLFLSEGVVSGDRVLLTGDNCGDFAACVLGIFLAGAVLVPANPAYSDRELAYVIADSRPAAVICPESMRERLSGLASAAEAPSAITGPGADLPVSDGKIRVLGLERAADTSEPGSLGRSQADPTRPAMIAYTSGTTGAPKGALLSHANLLASARSVAQAWHWSSRDRLLLTLPLFHMHGLGVGLLGSFLMGSSVVLFTGFDPGALATAIGEESATMFFGVPAMYRRLVADPLFSEFRRLRLLVSGSAPLPPDLFEAIERITGAPPIERYGMSETAMNVSNPYSGRRKAGTVGFPLPGVEIALDVNGEILVRGENVFGGYLGNAAATSERFEDGWFRTGDLGSLDEEGYLRIEGRSSDMIITGGFNVYPREVEEQLRTHYLIADAAVVGVPSERWGEEVVAFVVAAPDAAIEEGLLKAHCAERLAPYKVPKRFIEVEGFPRNSMGKVLGYELRRIGAEA